MTTHKTGSREQWLAARLKLLDAEKALTRQSDELARRRQELPWVRVKKDYRFDTDEGKASLADLFRGRSQLLVYHFMFGPDYKAGCISCSSIADGFNGIAVHLTNHDVMLWAASRTPLPKLQAFKQGLSITTFRYVPSDLTTGSEQVEAYLNQLNAELLTRLQRSGEAFLSNAVVRGTFLLRACIVNFRTSLEDVEALPVLVIRIGREVDVALRPVELNT